MNFPNNNILNSIYSWVRFLLQNSPNNPKTRPSMVASTLAVSAAVQGPSNTEVVSNMFLFENSCKYWKFEFVMCRVPEVSFDSKLLIGYFEIEYEQSLMASGPIQKSTVICDWYKKHGNCSYD